MSNQTHTTPNIKLKSSEYGCLTDRVSIMLSHLPKRIGRMSISGYVQIYRVYACVSIDSVDYLADVITGRLWLNGRSLDGIRTLDLARLVTITHKQASAWVKAAPLRQSNPFAYNNAKITAKYSRVFEDDE